MVEWISQENFVPYLETITSMEARVKNIQNKKDTECVWLLEHPPLYSLGLNADERDVLPSNSLPVFKTRRGGKVTYHGPGQRVVYLMLDLSKRNQDIRQYVFDLEEWGIQTLAYFGVTGERRKGRIGIWVQKDGYDHKIAALGVRVQKWITSHGLALNVNPDLTHYQHIVPCGIRDFGVTSLSDLGLSVSLKEVDDILRKTFPFAPCA